MHRHPFAATLRRMPQAGTQNAPRISEWVLAGYFAYTTVLALALPLAASLRIRSVCASLGALAVLHWMGRSSLWRGPNLVRDILPIGGVLLAYRQVGWFAQPRAELGLELRWVRWDRILLSDWRLGEAIEALGPVLPETLEFLYLLTYAVAPIGLLVLAAAGRLAKVDRFLAFYAASAVAAYALYPYFPSEPPRTAFPGDLASQYESVFRSINWWILGLGGIHTSVFPSGHTASAFGAGFGLFFAVPERRHYGTAMTALAAGISVATVYGRYHFAVDAVAGLAVSCVASLACVRAFRLRDSKSPDSRSQAGT